MKFADKKLSDEQFHFAPLHIKVKLFKPLSITPLLAVVQSFKSVSSLNVQIINYPIGGALSEASSEADFPLDDLLDSGLGLWAILT